MIVKPPTRTKQTKWLKFILNLFMAILYVGIGAFIFFSPQSSRLVPASYIPLVGIALIFYGFFRAFRAYLQFKNPRVF